MVEVVQIEALASALCAPAGVSFAVQAIRSATELDALAWDATHYLCGTERERFALLRSNKRKAEFCAGRIAAKRLLMRPQFGLAPSSFEIERTSSGAPRLCFGDESHKRAPHLSITHSAGFAVVVAAPFPVGIDLEQVEPRPDSFIQYFLCDAERSRVAGLASEQRDVAVNRFWSSKEAISKVHGWGSRLPLQALDCTLERISFAGYDFHCASAVRAGFVASLAYESYAAAQWLRPSSLRPTTDMTKHG